MNREKEFYDGLVVLDTEATGRDPFEAEVIEVGMHFPGLDVDTTDLYRPLDNKVPYPVQAVTNITTEMVADAPYFKDNSASVQKLIEQMDTVVAQNIWYDKSLLERYDVTHPSWLCTMRLAKQLYSGDDSFEAYNLAYLRYRLHAEVVEKGSAHRALADAYVTFAVLKKLVAEAVNRGIINDDSPWNEQLIEYINKPLVVRKMPFGKHKGELLEDVPLSYWKWAMKNLDSLDEESNNYDSDFADSVAMALEKIM